MKILDVPFKERMIIWQIYKATYQNTSSLQFPEKTSNTYIWATMIVTALFPMVGILCLNILNGLRFN